MDDLRSPSQASHWVTIALVLASTGLMLLAGWAAVFQQVRSETDLAADAAAQQAQNRALAFEQYVARTLEGADLVTRHVADKYLQQAPTRPKEMPIVPILIKDPVVAGTTFGVVTAVSPSGDLLATSDERAAHPTNVSRSAVFRKHKSHLGTDLLISPPTISRVLNDTFIYLTRRVVGPAGATLGYVGVQIRPEDLSSFIRSARFEPTDLISVIGLDGITRARREGSRLSFGENVSGRLVMRMQQLDPNISYVGPSSLDGHVRFFTQRRVPGYPIFVTAGVSKAAALAPAQRNARLYYGVMGVITVVSLLLASAILVSVRRRNSRAKALAAANQRLREAQRIAKTGDWECNLETGAILWSDQLCEMYERRAGCDRFHLDEFYTYLDDEGRSAVARMMESAVSTGEPQTCEFKAHLPSGSTSERHLNAIPVRSAEGVVTALRGTDQDVTADKVVAALQEQINHLSRVDAMNTMAATLAHELNQPLTAASSYLSGGERLLRRSDEAARAMTAEALSAARRQVQMAGDIIRQVRDMLSSERRVGEAVDIANLVSDTIALLARIRTCSRKWVRCDVHEGADTVWGNRIQIQQVLLNLVKNACEAAAKGEKPLVLVQVKPSQDGFVAITVTDNGGGIDGPPEQLFSPFRSTKEGGLGLGLSISRTIVEYHGGRIWVEFTGSSGTAITFTVRAEAESQMQFAEAS